jgi:hypothetical protein
MSFQAARGGRFREAITTTNFCIVSACDNGHAEIVKLLLDRGASRKSKDSVGQTALDIAKISGRTEIVALFKSRPH